MADGRPDGHDGLILKVLSGPHLGAEVLLGRGAYVVGRDEACDIVLDDRMIEPQHARIAVEAGAVTITSRGGAIAIEGRLVDADTVPLSHFDVCSFGGTSFVVGPAQGVWPRIVLPEAVPATLRTGAGTHRAPADEASAEETPANGATPDAAAGDAPSDDPPEAPEAAPGAAEDRSAVPTPDNPDTAPRPAGRGSGRLGLVALIALAMLALAGGSLWSHDWLPMLAPTPVPAPDASVTATAALQALIARLEMDDHLSVTGRPGARPLIEGTLAGNGDLAVLQEEVRKAGLVAQIAVRTGEDMVANARAIMTALKLPYPVRYRHPGQLAVTGELRSPSDRAALDHGLRALKADIPGLRRLLDETTMAPVPEPVPEPQPARPVAAQKEDTPAAVEPPRLAVRSVSVGAVPFVVLEDGRRYFAGGRLDDGAVIRSIAGDRLVIEKEGQVFDHVIAR